MDRYDRAIEYLAAHPDEISKAWGSPTTHPAGCLFQFAARGPTPPGCIGCLTMIRCLYCPHDAATPELTAAIRADDRIPMSEDIGVEHLPVFAEWQRRLDDELA